MPLEGASAKLCSVRTYSIDTWMLCFDVRAMILCNTRFCWSLRDRPALMAPITPWLSEWRTTLASCTPDAIKSDSASSTATISAQPMFHPSLLQFPTNSHMAYDVPRMTPIP